MQAATTVENCLNLALVGEIIKRVKESRDMDENRHPGINMHKLPVGGGFVGLLFAAGSALIFLLGFPTLWYFVALAFALGIGVAVVLRFVNHHRSQRNKPLSILAAPEKTEGAVSRGREERRKFRHPRPKLSLA